jgi:hypothetical protein
LVVALVVLIQTALGLQAVLVVVVVMAQSLVA